MGSRVDRQNFTDVSDSVRASETSATYSGTYGVISQKVLVIVKAKNLKSGIIQSGDHLKDLFSLHLFQMFPFVYISGNISSARGIDSSQNVICILLNPL
jgi:hypothetical protein